MKSRRGDFKVGALNSVQIKSSRVWVSTEKRIRQNAEGIEEEPAIS